MITKNFFLNAFMVVIFCSSCFFRVQKTEDIVIERNLLSEEEDNAEKIFYLLAYSLDKDFLTISAIRYKSTYKVFLVKWKERFYERREVTALGNPMLHCSGSDCLGFSIFFASVWVIEFITLPIRLINVPQARFVTEINSGKQEKIVELDIPDSVSLRTDFKIKRAYKLYPIQKI